MRLLAAPEVGQAVGMATHDGDMGTECRGGPRGMGSVALRRSSVFAGCAEGAACSGRGEAVDLELKLKLVCVLVLVFVLCIVYELWNNILPRTDSSNYKYLQ